LDRISYPVPTSHIFFCIFIGLPMPSEVISHQ
jgi:hypothetical protein